MRLARKRWAAALVLLACGVSTRADEPGLLGRLFRLGGNTAPEPATRTPAPAPHSEVIAPTTTGAHAPARLVPQPRDSKPPTESDPLVTRVTLGRSDDGRQFGMFLQVFADGTVIDGEGVHTLGREAVRPVVDALAQGDLYRVKGHCGGPPTDFIELVHVVVYERSLGRLRANAFSFSGNSQGCDHAVKHLQTKLDELQARVARPASMGSVAPVQAPWNAAPVNAPAIQLNAVPD